MPKLSRVARSTIDPCSPPPLGQRSATSPGQSSGGRWVAITPLRGSAQASSLRDVRGLSMSCPPKSRVSAGRHPVAIRRAVALHPHRAPGVGLRFVFGGAKLPPPPTCGAAGRCHSSVPAGSWVRFPLPRRVRPCTPRARPCAAGAVLQAAGDLPSLLGLVAAHALKRLRSKVVSGSASSHRKPAGGGRSFGAASNRAVSSARPARPSTKRWRACGRGGP